MPDLLELFVDNLDRDLARRRREITDLRLLVAASSGDRLALLARACHVITYAHWEGFVRSATRSYLAYVLTRNETVAALKIGFQALAIQTQLRAAAASWEAIPSVTEMIEYIDTRSINRFEVDPDKSIQTGNLNSAKFKAFLASVSLEYLDTYKTRENFIDEILCGRRHRIAHGHWQPVTADDARSVADDVLLLCTEFAEQLQDAALYEQYKA